MTTSTFREVQSFRQPWIWCLLIVCCGLPIALFFYGLIHQLVRGEQWGNQPMSDFWLAFTFLLTVAVGVGLGVLFWQLRLIVEVRPEGVWIRYRPIKTRTVPYGEIVRVEACTYRPIAHYGGWGIKRGRQGWAYNVSGNRGVRLDLAGGKHLLIGSQRPVDLAAAIEARRGR